MCVCVCVCVREREREKEGEVYRRWLKIYFQYHKKKKTVKSLYYIVIPREMQIMKGRVRM